MPYNAFLYELSPFYLLQAALTLWMLVDAHRRGVDYYWYWIILVFQPLGAWAYFFIYKAKDLHVDHGWLTSFFHRPPSLQELRRAQPNISLAWIAERIPVTQDARHSEAFRRARELYLEAFRRAGLD